MIALLRRGRPRRTQSAPTECTGFAAAWCPVHGGCDCADAGPVEAFTLDRRDCPLHGLDSDHPRRAAG